MYEFYESSSGETYEFLYVVGQMEDEEDQMKCRNVDKTVAPNDGWKDWPEGLPIPSEVAAHFFGELRPGEGFDVPSFFGTFSAIRAAGQTLKQARHNTVLATKPELAAAIKDMLETIEMYGDLDENYTAIARAALSNEHRGRGELDYLSR